MMKRGESRPLPLWVIVYAPEGDDALEDLTICDGFFEDEEEAQAIADAIWDEEEAFVVVARLDTFFKVKRKHDRENHRAQ